MPSRPAPALGLATACVLLAGVAALAFENSDRPPHAAGFAGAVPLTSAAAPVASRVTRRPPAPPRSTARPAPVPTPAQPPAEGALAPAPGSTADARPSPSPATAAPTGGSARQDYAHQVFLAVNRARRTAHLPELRWSARLHDSAGMHDRAMAAANTLSHQVGGEASLGVRESEAGIRWTWAAENIGWTTDNSLAGALDVQARMLTETPPNDAHRRSILSTRAEALGVDVYYDVAHGRLWLTEDFAGTG